MVADGTTGIGLTIAQTLAHNGASKVFIVGRRLEKLQEAAATSPHGNIIPIQADVTSKDDLKRVVAQVTADVGYVNLLACNAGTTGPNMLSLKKDPTPAELRDYVWENWSTEDFTQTFDVNVTSVFFTAIAFVELLDKGNARGNMADITSQVIVTASVASYLRRMSTGFAYSISKAAVNHTFKMLSTYLGPYSIRVNALNPGPFPSNYPTLKRTVLLTNLA